MRLWWTTLRVLCAAVLLIVGCQPAPVVPAATSAPAATNAPAPGATQVGQSAAQAVPTTQASNAAAPQPTAKAGGQLVYAVVGSDVRILNPILQSDTVSGAITERLFEPLVYEDPKTGAPVPSLADSWTISPDGLVYTFKIHPGVKFHDGQPMTADDAKFTLDILKTDKVKTTRTANVEKIQSTEVVDPLTLRVTLSEVFCPFLNSLTPLGILPKHLLENTTNLNEDPFNLKPIGTGPFTFVEWVKDDHVTLQANDNYWNGRPKIDRFVFKPLKDRGALLAQLKTGDVDIATIEPLEVKEMSAEPNLQIVTYYAAGITYLGYNTRLPGLDDVQVRQALNYALDRQVIIDQVLLGEGRPMASDVPQDSWAYDPNVMQYDFNPDKARQLLDSAGWVPGADGVRAKNGQLLKFTLWTNSGDKVREAIVTIAQQQFNDVGVSVDLQFEDFASLINQINKVDFGMFVSGFVFGADPDNYDLWHSSRKPDPTTGKEGFNRVGFSTPELDQLMEQGRTLPGCDQARRKDIYAQDQAIVANGAPWNFLHQAQTPIAVNKRVVGVQPSTWRRFLYNVQDWTLQ
jgi:peptide/nickel transport system substrate-binding protein